jgi:uncharacterized protein YvpB
MKKILNGLIVLGVVILAVFGAYKLDVYQRLVNAGIVPVQEHVQLDVPLLRKDTPPALGNGSEVTAMAMLLQYYGYHETKNNLSANLPRVPWTFTDGEHGNPNVGFVGSVTGESYGLGAYHQPMIRLAHHYTGHASDVSGSSFDQIVRILATGHPVWTITTTTFAPVHDWQRWDTPQGRIKITYSMNGVIITGYDRAQKLIYVNDPYGHKNKAVNWDKFQAAYNQMGQQAIYIK